MFFVNIHLSVSHPNPLHANRNQSMSVIYRLRPHACLPPLPLRFPPAHLPTPHKPQALRRQQQPPSKTPPGRASTDCQHCHLQSHRSNPVSLSSPESALHSYLLNQVLFFFPFLSNSSGARLSLVTHLLPSF